MGGGASINEVPITHNPQMQAPRSDLSVSVNPSGDSVSYGNRCDEECDPRKEGYIIGTVDMRHLTKIRLDAFVSTSTNDFQITEQHTVSEFPSERKPLDPRVEGFIIGASS